MILWAPSALALEHYRKTYPLLPTPDELLWLVRAGHVQIRGREWWISDRSKRDHHKWPFASWVESFDTEVQRIWLEDQRHGRTGASARVVAVGQAKGPAWARRQIEAGNVDPQRFVRLLSPQGGRTSFLRYEREGLAMPVQPPEATQFILGAVRNHAEAYAQSGADRNLGLPGDRRLIRAFRSSVEELGADVVTTLKEEPDLGVVVNAVTGIVRRLETAGAPPRDTGEAFTRMQTTLDSGDERDRLREWISSVETLALATKNAHLSQRAAADLVTELERSAPNRTLWDCLRPANTELAVNLVTLAFAAAAGTAEPSSVPLALTILPAQLGRAMRWLGIVPDRQFGPKWPYCVALGRRSPRRRDREALVEALRR